MKTRGSMVFLTSYVIYIGLPIDKKKKNLDVMVMCKCVHIVIV